MTTTETPRPPMIARASGAYCSLPASIPSAIGIMPSSVASDVIRIGRRRILHASTVASSRGRPWLRKIFVKSTMRMLLETTMPVIMIVPINDMMLSVLPVRRRISTTPARPGGIAIRMIKGSMNELNCAISTR